VVNIDADAAPSGQEFDAWTGDVTNVADVNSTSTTLTMPAASTSVTATYKDLPAEEYTLTTLESPNVSGDITVDPVKASYTSGEQVTITAPADACYDFTGWSGASTSTATSVTITMDSDKSITANYTDNGSCSGESTTVSFRQSASFDMEGANLHSTWCTGCNYGSVAEFKMNSDFTHFILGSDISSIPSGATITNVSLSFYNSSTLYGGNSVSSEVRALNASFDEDVVTYNSISTAIDNTTSGLLGTYSLVAASGDPQTNAEVVVASSSNFVSAAQSALDGNGFFSLAVVSDANTALYYHSDDASTEGYRPRLTIEYTDPKSAKGLMDGLSADASVKIYPNPSEAGRSLTLELIGFENEANATINIMDISGRTAYSTSVKTHGHASPQMEISLEGISSGMYIVVVKSENKVVNQQLIIR
jgi:uncharacterized repeat protein (TIGR02543 family)